MRAQKAIAILIVNQRGVDGSGTAIGLLKSINAQTGVLVGNGEYLCDFHQAAGGVATLETNMMLIPF
ncbi:MAG: hypothetical protein JXB10_12460 [Pirellulales bacterium]|nr:hypothetical protein [Pirellulales bacterium]